MGFCDDIRLACARVAARARHVRVVEEAVEPYARTLPAESPPAPDLPPGTPDEARAAFGLQLNAVNFGSGWFPTLRKPPGLSGFRTVEAGLRAHGPWRAEELARVEAAEVAAVFGQDAEHELMALFARALRELGALPMWRDVSSHGGEPVPFYKRAQLAAADLHLQGIAPARDLPSLTLFADNLVPHVLRLDGVLEFEPELVARIDSEELLDHDSAEEVEIRACAVHAVELLVEAKPRQGEGKRHISATVVDNVLWHRGAGRRYKERPRHRARTTAY